MANKKLAVFSFQHQESAKPMRSLIPVYVTFLLAFICMLMPLPLWAEWLKPSWVVLVLLYWVLVMPNRVGLGLAWITGLLLDGVMNIPFGVNAFALVVISYFLIRFNANIRTMFFLPKMAMIFLLLFCYQLILIYFVAVKGSLLFAIWLGFLHALVSVLIWPWLAIILFEFQRRFLPSIE